LSQTELMVETPQIFQGLPILTGLVLKNAEFIQSPFGVNFGNSDKAVRNRSRAALKKHIGSYKVIIWNIEEHGTKIRRVSAKSRSNALADGMITDETEIVITAKTGDCGVAVVYSEDPKCVGIMHIGKAGAEKEAAILLVQAMETEFNARPAQMTAWITPSAGGEYFVFPNEAEYYPAAYKKIIPAYANAIYQHKPMSDERRENIESLQDPYRYIAILQIKEWIRDQLISCGVPSRQIEMSPIDTVRHPSKYVSFRASGNPVKGGIRTHGLSVVFAMLIS